MKHTLAAVCGATLLIISAHRLPAPIVEPEEKPASTPSKTSAAARQKPSATSKATFRGPNLSGERVKRVEDTSKAELIHMFGPATKDYKVPGHQNYEVVAFKPLFKNWSERVFLFRNGRYQEQANGQYRVEIRLTKNGEVRIVKVGPTLGRPIGPPRPKGGW